MTTRQRLISGAGASAALLIAVGFWRYACASKGLSPQKASVMEKAHGAKSVEAQLFEVRKSRLPDAINGLIGTIKGNTIELTFNGQEERLAAAHVQVGQRVKITPATGVAQQVVILPCQGGHHGKRHHRN